MTRATPYVIKQTDRALETAIAFIRARQAGEISYGRSGRSAGCIVTHPNFRERWLKVKWWAAGEMIRFFWDGDLLSIGLEGVSKPRIFGFFDWEAIGIYHRATMMSLVSGFLCKGRTLDHEPALSGEWWQRLKNAVVAVQTKQTDRTYTQEGRLARLLNERFGFRLKQPFPFWQTAHGDLHWANVTAPELSIVDWETWGRAPYGLDIASLHLHTLTQSETLAKLKDAFSMVIARPEYDIAFLYLAAEEMQRFDEGRRVPQLEPYLHAEADRVLAERRYVPFCE